MDHEKLSAVILSISEKVRRLHPRENGKFFVSDEQMEIADLIANMAYDYSVLDEAESVKEPQ